MKRSLGVIASVTFLLLFLVYAGFETWKFVAGPSLNITKPSDFETVIDPMIKVEGVVKRAAFISINGNQVFADKDGNILNELLLPEGYTIIRVEVKDRFGKEVKKDIHITYLPQATAKKIVIDTASSTKEASSTEINNN